MWDALIITPFINALLFIYSLVGNFGIAIILFTILIRLITHPLMASQIKGSKAMQTLQQDKRYIEIQTKYKDDKEFEDKRLAIVDIAKHRNGATGEVRLNFEDLYTRFENRQEGVDMAGE